MIPVFVVAVREHIPAFTATPMSAIWFGWNMMPYSDE